MVSFVAGFVIEPSGKPPVSVPDKAAIADCKPHAGATGIAPTAGWSMKAVDVLRNASAAELFDVMMEPFERLEEPDN